MDMCKYIVPVRHGVTLNSHQTTSPLVRLVEVEDRKEVPGNLQRFTPQNWGGTEPNHSISCWCSELRLTTGVYRSLRRNDFRGPRCDTVRHIELVTTTCIK
ncbi:hypothetical protein TNCV_5087071 [Trichonephila clavipes]|nr:hypothetical protein TNCV_5087071 [Trichonephila clavipes]